MKHFAMVLIMVFVLSACGPAPTSAPTPDTQATIAYLAGTMVAKTLTAQPSVTPQPSETPLPSPTSTTAPTATATIDLSATPNPLTPGGPTPTAWFGTFVPGNVDGLPTGFLRIENQTGEKMVMITLQGVTLTREQPVTYNFSITKFTVYTVLWASYKYIIQVPNKKIYTGNLTIANKDKTTIRIYLNKDPVIVGP